MHNFDEINDRFPVTQVLETYGIKVKHGGVFECPFHDDSDRSSGSVYTVNGREKWKCHAASCTSKGGDSIDFVQEKLACDRWEAIRELTGEGPPRPEARPRPAKKPELKLVRDLIPFPKEHGFRPGQTPEILTPKTGRRTRKTAQLVHLYRNQGGEILMITIRVVKPTGGKVVYPIRYDRKDGPVMMGWQPGETRLLYNEPMLRLRPEDPVLVVEGEKVADILKLLPQFADYIVLSWQGGTSAAKFNAWDKLKGRKVVLWPDADEGGPKAMQLVAKGCQPAEVAIVAPLQEWFDRDIGYDAADLLDDLKGDAAEARRIMENLCHPYDDGGKPPDPPEPDPQDRDGGRIPYLRNLEKGGIAVREEVNWQLFVERDPRFPHQLAYDVFDKAVLVDGVPLDDDTGQVGRLAHAIGEIGNFRSLKVNRIGEIITQAAKRHPVNRLADELRAVPWDGVQRHLLAYAGAIVTGEAGRWARIAGWRWLLGYVRRILEPGCSHDLVLVLEGRQGVGKSRFFQALGQVCGRNLYTDMSRLAQDKDVQMKFIGKAVVELSEMTAHRLGDTDALKGMITSPIDHYRAPYGRRIEEVPRTCVFGGSTNEQRYLKDMTGNRRYLIVAIEAPVDIEGLRRDLPQLLAEAVHFISNGETPEDSQNWLTPEEEKLQVTVTKTREVEWPQFEGLDEILESKPEVTVLSSNDIRQQYLNIPRDRWNNQLKAGLTKYMTDMGWTYSTTTRRWKRPKLDDPQL